MVMGILLRRAVLMLALILPAAAAAGSRTVASPGCSSSV